MKDYPPKIQFSAFGKNLEADVLQVVTAGPFFDESAPRDQSVVRFDVPYGEKWVAFLLNNPTERTEKPFLLFMGSMHSKGGWGDFKGGFLSVEDACQFAKDNWASSITGGDGPEDFWFEIVEVRNERVVKKGRLDDLFNKVDRKNG